MNSWHVKHFLTIVKYMNMTKAAEELFITQSALSQSISRLEAELGFKLFHRDKKRLILSKEGEEMLPYLNELNMSHERVIDKARKILTDNEKTFVIGYAGSVVWYSSMVMNNYWDAFRYGKTETIYADPDKLESMLLTNQIDIIIGTVITENPLIKMTTLLEDKIMLVVPKGNPLSEKTSVSIRMICDLPFTMLPENAYFRQYCDEILNRHQIRMNAVRSNSQDIIYENVRQKAIEDDYMSLCPISVCPATYGEDEYSFIPFEEKFMTIKYCIYYLSEKEKDCRHIIEFVKTGFDVQFANYCNLIHSLTS